MFSELLRRSRQPLNREGWYQGASKDKDTNASPRRDLRRGHGGSAQGKLRGLPTPQRLRHLLQHDPQEGQHNKKVVQTRDKGETFARIRGAVAHILSNRSLTSAPWKKTKGVSIAKVFGKDTLPGTLDLQREGNFEEDEKI